MTPLFRDASGSLTALLEFSSSRRRHSFVGTIPAGTVDVQVNLNGQGFVSDPTLVAFDQETFEVPGPLAYPEGFLFEEGTNTLEIRTIDGAGNFSTPALARVTVLTAQEAEAAPPPPSGLRVRRLRDAVEIVWAETNWPGVIGYHVYASANPATDGYVRINKDLIVTPSFEEEFLTDITEDVAFFDNNYGQLRIFLGEEDFNGSPLGPPVQDALVDTSLAGPRIKVGTSVQSVENVRYFTFRHPRTGGADAPHTINSDIFQGIPPEAPLYYVITTISMRGTREESESAYSAELEGAPLTINTQYVDPPARTRFEVSEDYVTKILQYDPEISVIPGSVTRDIFIDPFATEAERLYFIADFVRRTQSFATLLVVDAMPSYKQALASALGLGAVDSVQAVIDDAFDKLAANVNVQRQGARPAVGTVTFYTTTEPQQDIQIPQGTIVSGGGASFRTTSSVILPHDLRQSYYNKQRRRWEIRANIQATLPGSSGNVGANKITQVTGGALRVINLEATTFGQDEESNEELATRAILAFSAVDAGTASGYLATALKRPGVIKASVIDAGNPWMIRDYDNIRGRHIGGKVDVWVQGSFMEQVSDTFALGYNIISGATFVLVSDPSEYVFEIDDPRISPETPLTEIIGTFRNVRTGEAYDTTNYTLEAYNRVRLEAGLPGQPPVGVNDLVVADVKWRRQHRFIFSRQPVSGVNHIISTNDPAATPLQAGQQYQLYRREDPLAHGYSTKAADYIEIYDGGQGPGAIGGPQQVFGEFHILLGDEDPAQLQNLGVHPSSIVVRKAGDPGHIFRGPDDTGTPDYFVEPGDEVTPCLIYRNPNGNIAEGEEVEVDYEHDENFEVSYVVNTLLRDVQGDLDKQRHITADVLAKEVVTNPIDIDMVVTLRPGAQRSDVDAAIRTNLTKVLAQYPIGGPAHQSDIVQAVENVEGVDHVVLPLARMSHRDGNLIVRESLNPSFTYIGTGLGGRHIYKLNQRLRYNTMRGGGLGTEPIGVFRGQEAIKLAPDVNALFTQSQIRAAYVSGHEGVIIPGFSDNGTLEAEGYQDVVARRAEISGNSIFLSFPAGETPAGHGPGQGQGQWEVTYQVWGEGQKAHSTIYISGVAKAVLGDVSITYVETT